MSNAQQCVHLIAATTGFTSFALLWLGVLWGTLLRLGWGLTRVRHHTLYGTHHFFTLVGLVLGIVHALAQLVVPHGPVGWLGEWVPFVTSHDPVGIGLGVVALEIMLALAISVLLQRRMGHNRWRRLHATGYLAFTALGAHVLVAGSDVHPTPIRIAVVAAWAATVVLRLATAPAVAALLGGAGRRVSGRTQVAQLTVQVDPIRCARFGFCEHEAPQVFRLRGDGRLVYRKSVPARETEAVIRAADVCPARAIIVDRLATLVVMPAVDEVTPAGSGSGQVRGGHRQGGRR